MRSSRLRAPSAPASRARAGSPPSGSRRGRAPPRALPPSPRGRASGRGRDAARPDRDRDRGGRGRARGRARRAARDGGPLARRRGREAPARGAHRPGRVVRRARRDVALARPRGGAGDRAADGARGGARDALPRGADRRAPRQPARRRRARTLGAAPVGSPAAAVRAVALRGAAAPGSRAAPVEADPAPRRGRVGDGEAGRAVRAVHRPGANGAGRAGCPLPHAAAGAGRAGGRCRRALARARARDLLPLVRLVRPRRLRGRPPLGDGRVPALARPAAGDRRRALGPVPGDRADGATRGGKSVFARRVAAAAAPRRRGRRAPARLHAAGRTRAAPARRRRAAPARVARRAAVAGGALYLRRGGGGCTRGHCGRLGARRRRDSGRGGAGRVAARRGRRARARLGPRAHERARGGSGRGAAVVRGGARARCAGRAARPDVAAAGALAVVVVGRVRGSVGAYELVANGRTGTFLLLVPALVTFAAAVVAARVLAPARRALGRIGGRGRVALRLAALSLARSPGSAAVTATFLVASLGLALFAATYRSTLARGQLEEAAYAVPAPYVLTEDLSQLVPVLRAAPREPATKVLRLSGNVPSGVAFTALGVPARSLPTIGGWRDDFSRTALPELAARLRPEQSMRLRTSPLPPGRTLEVPA